MYKLAGGVQIRNAIIRGIARINKKLSSASIPPRQGGHGKNLVNSRYNFRAVAQKKKGYVKKGKKKPNAKHPVELGINRHSKLNDGNK
ncbi:hypothetical protein [Enterobacter sp. P82]|uniref:hypothetical protein n=1 Tax=Enterobacter sp. P82 TaxID=3123033 RepID=UPI00300D088C